MAEATVGNLGEWVGGGGGGEDGDCGFALVDAVGDGGGAVDGAVDSGCHFEGVCGVVVDIFVARLWGEVVGGE